MKFFELTIVNPEHRYHTVVQQLVAQDAIDREFPVPLARGTPELEALVEDLRTTAKVLSDGVGHHTGVARYALSYGFELQPSRPIAGRPFHYRCVVKVWAVVDLDWPTKAEVLEALKLPRIRDRKGGDPTFEFGRHEFELLSSVDDPSELANYEAALIELVDDGRVVGDYFGQRDPDHARVHLMRRCVVCGFGGAKPPNKICLNCYQQLSPVHLRERNRKALDDVRAELALRSAE